MRFRDLISLQEGDRAALRLGSKDPHLFILSCMTDVSLSSYWSHVLRPASRLSAQRPTSPAFQALMIPGPRPSGPDQNRGFRKSPPGRAGHCIQPLDFPP